MDTTLIEARYDKLADSDCSLSCGRVLLFSNVKNGEVCIDLGSGRGLDAIKLASLTGESGFVYGIDASNRMIEKAEENASKFEIKNIKFIKSELENINLQSEIADLIISNCTINHASDKTAVFKEIFRLLKHKGRFVISDIYSLYDVPDEYAKDPLSIAECWGGAITKQAYLAIIENAGFKNINILEESKPYNKGKINIAGFTVTCEKLKNL